LFFSETVAALQAFRKRHADAQRIHAQLSSQPATVDLTHYRSTLKNKGIVDDAEKLLNEFKPVTYDVNAHVKAIETFEAKAVGVFVPCTLPPSHNILQVSRAKETETKIDEELKELQATLANIEEARPFEDLTVSPPSSRERRHLINTSQATEVGEAHPRIVEAVETMIKKGKWTVPGKMGCLYRPPIRPSSTLRVQGEVRRLEPYVVFSRAIEWNDMHPFLSYHHVGLNVELWVELRFPHQHRPAPAIARRGWPLLTTHTPTTCYKHFHSIVSPRIPFLRSGSDISSSVQVLSLFVFWDFLGLKQQLLREFEGRIGYNVLNSQFLASDSWA
jgi:F-type H+-transporting ATPase subunit d